MSARATTLTACLLVLATITSVARAEAPHVRAGEPLGTVHVRLDASATYGIGGQSFVGALTHISVGVSAWDDGEATGSLDVGLGLAYHNEPTWLAPWLSGGGVEGAAHRAQTLLMVGHTFHMLPGRELSLGLHAYAGWNRWISSYALTYEAENVRGAATIERDQFVTGAQLTLAGRVAERVGLQLVLGGPFPTESSYVVGMFHVGLGLSFYLY